MFKKILFSLASAIAGITLLACTASAALICDPYSPKDKIKINDFYFEDFETGEKCYAVNSYPDEIAAYFDELVFWCEETRTHPGERREDPFDRMYLSFTVTDPNSKYYGKTFNYSIGDNRIRVYQSPMYEFANAFLYNIQDLFWNSYGTGENNFDNNITTLNEIYKNSEMPTGTAEIAMTATIMNNKDKSLKCKAVAVDGSMDYNRKYTTGNSAYPETNIVSKEQQSVDIAMRVGDKFSVYPCMKLTIDGKDVWGEKTSITDIISYGGFIKADNKYSNKTIEYEISNKSVLESSTYFAGVQNDDARQGTLVLNALKEGTTTLTIKVNLYINHQDYATKNVNKEYEYFKLLFPTLICADSTGNNNFDSFITLTATYNVHVYPASEDVTIKIDGVDISTLDMVYSDCDFAVSANDDLDVTAEIKGGAYSYSFADCENITLTSSDGTVVSSVQNEAQKISFNSGETKIIEFKYGTKTKKIKIIPNMYQFENFLARYQLDTSELLYVPVGGIESMSAYITDLMVEASGNKNYGIPMFPKEKSITLSYDSNFLSNPTYDRLKGLKEVAETKVTANIGCGDGSFYPVDIMVCVFSGKPELFVVSACDVEDLYSLRKMQRNEIKDIALNKNNKNEILSGTSNVFYIFQYPNFTAKLDVAIKYGSSLAKVNKIGKNTYSIDTIELGGSITLSVKSTDLKEELYLLDVLNIQNIVFDKFKIVYRIKTPSMGDFSFKGQDVTSREFLDSVMMQMSGCYETKSYDINFYANAKPYDGDIYFMYNGNVAMSSPNWEFYSKGNGVHSDIYKYKPVGNKKNGAFTLMIEESGATGTLYAFVKPPNGAQTVNNILNAANNLVAVCEITSVADNNSQTGPIGYDSMNDIFTNPFDGTIPIYDDAGEIAAYYRCELSVVNENVSLSKNAKKTVRAVYKETAYIPYIVTRIGNDVLYCNNKAISVSSMFAAQMIMPDGKEWFIWTKNGDKAVFGSDVCTLPGQPQPINTSDILPYYGIRVWVESPVPATASAAKLVEGTVKAPGGTLTFTDTKGNSYKKNELCYAYVKGDTPENTITLDTITNENGAVYIQGQQWNSTENGNIKKTKKIKYNGETIVACVRKEIPVMCPESSVVPRMVSSNLSVAKAENSVPSSVQSLTGIGNIASLLSSKYTFNVNITGVNSGSAKITVYGKCSTKAEINVTVNGNNNSNGSDGGSDSGIVKETTLSSGLGYRLETPKSVYNITGNSIQIPFTATSYGSSAMFGQITDPYKGVTAYTTSKGGTTVEVSKGMVTVSNLPKGTYLVNISAPPLFTGLFLSITVNVT